MIDTPGYMRDTCTFLKWYFSSKNSSYWDALRYVSAYIPSTWDKYPTSARPTNNFEARELSEISLNDLSTVKLLGNT